jgi:hypothetical protein
MQHTGTTESGETVGGSSGSGDFSSGGDSAERISDRRSNANGEVLVKVRRRAPAANGPGGVTLAAGPSGTGSKRRKPSYRPGRHLSPGQALVTQLQNLLCGGRMSGRTFATHGDAGPAKPFAHGGPGNA